MIPDGFGNLLSKSTKFKLVVIILGLVFSGLLDMLALVAIVPLMTILTGADYESGPTGTLWEFFGEPNNQDFALLIAVCTVSAFVTKAIVGVSFRWWSTRLLAKQETDTTVRLYSLYLQAPFSFHRDGNASELLHNLTWLAQSAFGGIGLMISFFAELITVSAVVLTLFIVNPSVALAAGLIFGVVGGIFLYMVRGRAKSFGNAVLVASQRSSLTAMHGLGGIREIKVRNNPQPFIAKFQEAQNAKTRASRANMLLTDLPKYFLEVLFVAGIAAIASFEYLTGGAANAVSTIALFAAAGFRLLPSVTRLLASWSGVRYTRSPLDSLIREFSKLEVESQHVGARGSIMYDGDIELASVSFAYPGSDEVISSIDLTIKKGSSVAIVGASGAGKSTLVDLLLGLQKPTRGKITCGQIDIHSSLVDWQDQIGFVPQDVFLMDTTLSENVAFDQENEDIDSKAMDLALEGAQLGAFVASQELGLETIVGDRGSRLSGGQRQRVGIARALYRSPAVLILDEATSALDNETESHITKTVEALKGRMTTIVVAHRLSTVRNCDRFVVLNAGEVEAYGTFDQVLKLSKSFKRMADLATLD